MRDMLPVLAFPEKGQAHPVYLKWIPDRSLTTSTSVILNGFKFLIIT